jgi:hypothetical protein
MIPVHQRDIIRAAPALWLRQYSGSWSDAKLPWNSAKTYGQVWRDLAALDLETCTPEDIDAAIGTTGWAANCCDECRDSFPVTLRICDEPDYEAKWQDLCAGCLAKAVDMLASTIAKP